MKGKYIYLVSYLYSASCLFSSCLVQLVDVAANLRRDSSRLISVWYLSPGLARSRGWNYCHSDQVLWHQQIIPISHLSLPFTGSTRGWDWTNTARGDCKFWPKSNCVWCVSPSVPWHHSLLYSLWPVAVSNDQGFVSFTVSPGQWRWYCQAV